MDLNHFIIDSHQHFWKFDPIRDNWIDENMDKIRKDFLPRDLEPIFQKCKINGCIAVQADQSLKETEFLLGLADETSFIKGVVGWVDLQSYAVSGQLEKYCQNNHFKGVRHIVQSEPSGFLLNDYFQKGISYLTEYNLSFDLLIFPNQLEEAIEFVSINKDLPIILDHLAKPYIKAGKIENWARGINKLANRENVFCKMSGMVTEAKWGEWKKEDFTPYLEIVLEEFGAERLMFGSDWPVCLLSGDYDEVLKIVLDFIGQLSRNEQTMIMGMNAEKIYNL